MLSEEFADSLFDQSDSAASAVGASAGAMAAAADETVIELEVVAPPPQEKSARKTGTTYVAMQVQSASFLTPAELEEFRELLLKKRREILANIGHLHGAAAEAKVKDQIRVDDVESAFDNVVAEIGLGLLSTEEEQLRQINEALSRLADGTYGLCAAADHAISTARLRALPWARYCIEHARSHEQTQRRGAA